MNENNFENMDELKDTETLENDTVNDTVQTEEPVLEKDGADTETLQETEQSEQIQSEEEILENVGEPAPKKSHKGLIISGIITLLLAVAASLFIFFVLLSPRAQFMKALDLLAVRHLGDFEEYGSLKEAVGACSNWTEAFSADLSLTTNSADEKKIALDYDSSAASLTLTENGKDTKLYLDKDIMVLANSKDPAYSINTSLLEANISEQDNAFLNNYKILFDTSSDERIQMTELLTEILSDNLSQDSFEECIVNNEGVSYDGIRFYVSENEAVTFLASVLEDIDKCENEALRLKTAMVLIEKFGVTKGADVSATIKNAIDSVTQNVCKIDVVIGLASGQPVAVTAKAAFGKNTLEAEYSFIRKSNTADVTAAFVFETQDGKTLFSYEGKRHFKGTQENETGEIMVSYPAQNEQKTLSGEINVVYTEEKLTSLNIALSSEDLADRFGLTLSLTDNLSLSYTTMTDGWGTSVVATATRNKSEGSYVLTNGKVSVNEIASDEMLSVNQLDANELGSYNVSFDLTLKYANNTASLEGNVKLGDETDVKIAASAQSESNFFAGLFASGFFDGQRINLNAEVNVKGKDTENVYKLSAFFDRTNPPEIVKMEGGEVINGTGSVFDEKKTEDMIAHFLETRNNSKMFSALWKNVIVTALDKMSGGTADLKDINRVELTASDYDRLVIGETDKKTVSELFGGAAPVIDENKIEYYYSKNYKKDQTEGILIYMLFDGNSKLNGKGIANYDLATAGDDLDGIKYKTVKKGMTKDKIDALFGEKAPVMAEAYVQEGKTYEHIYYGMVEGEVLFAVELVDGVVTQTIIH